MDVSWQTDDPVVAATFVAYALTRQVMGDELVTTEVLVRRFTTLYEGVRSVQYSHLRPADQT